MHREAQSADGTLVRYRSVGRGSPLLLLPGLALGAATTWGACLPALARAHRCLLVDVRGSGRSPQPTGPYALGALAADALAVLDAEGLPSAHVTGVSLGGVIAQALAGIAPRRIRSLALVATGCGHDPVRVRRLAEVRAAAEVRGLPGLFGALAPHTVAPPWRPLVRRVARTPAVDLVSLLRASGRSAVAQLDALLQADPAWCAGLAAVPAPLLAVVGTGDGLLSGGDARRLRAVRPDAEIVVLPVGHLLPLHPRRLLGVLGPFLAGADRGAGAAPRPDR